MNYQINACSFVLKSIETNYGQILERKWPLRFEFSVEDIQHFPQLLYFYTNSTHILIRLITAQYSLDVYLKLYFAVISMHKPVKFKCRSISNPLVFTRPGKTGPWRHGYQREISLDSRWNRFWPEKKKRNIVKCFERSYSQSSVSFSLEYSGSTEMPITIHSHWGILSSWRRLDMAARIHYLLGSLQMQRKTL